MKLLLCCFMCIGSVVMADAQDASNATMRPVPPGITIVNFNWARKFSPPPPVRGEVPPFDASQDSISPMSSSIRPGPLNNPFPSSGGLSYFYLYKMKIRNDGAKGIKAVAWEHIFDDPVSKNELGRRHLTSFKNIDVDSMETLRAKLPSPPSNVVSAEALGQNNRSPFVERIVIRCVLYRDGTLWEDPDAKGAGCDFLRHWNMSERSKHKQ